MHGRRTFEQSDVMLIKKGKRKEVIDTHIRAIVRECCVIMGGRNNKLKDQKGLDQKGLMIKVFFYSFLCALF